LPGAVPSDDDWHPIVDRSYKRIGARSEQEIRRRTNFGRILIDAREEKWPLVLQVDIVGLLLVAWEPLPQGYVDKLPAAN